MAPLLSQMRPCFVPARHRSIPAVEILEARNLLASLPIIPGTSIFNAVPEAANYGVVYELNIPTVANFSSSGVPYLQNNSAQVPASSFDRIAYALELNTAATPSTDQWIWVSFTRPTNITSAAAIGVPVLSTNEDYNFGNTMIASMNVFSNVAGIVTGTGISTGNIEFWPSNYSQGNQYNVPGANGGSYDFGDGGDSLSTGYGSMQLANYGSSQMLMSFNDWNGGSNTDLGIGNQVGGSGPDFTFAGNAGTYVLKHMYVLVREPADLSITKTDPATNVQPGQTLVYTITVTNNGPNAVTGATVADNIPANLTNVTWTATTSGGSSFSAGGTTQSGSGSINTTLNLLSGGTATFMVTATVSSSASAGTLSNTATVTAPAGIFDPNLANNMATVSNTIVPLPPPPPPPPPPVNPTTPFYAVGSGEGMLAQVNVYNSTNNQYLFTNVPFGFSFTGGTRVAIGDVNGDGQEDIICGAGIGGGPQVVVYNGRDNSTLFSFLAFGSTVSSSATAAAGISGPQFRFTGGVFVAAGDLFGNGYDDIIVGAGPGGGPQVNVYDGKTGALVSTFYAFAAGFTGGVRVAAGDLFGTGKDEIICAAGPGGGPQITVWDGSGQMMFASFNAFAASFAGGVFVGAGDVRGIGRADIVAGAGSGGGPQVTIYDGQSFSLVSSFYAFAAGFQGGVRVSTAGVPGQKQEVLTGAGIGGGPQVAIFDASTMALLGSFFAYNPGFNGGIFVGG